MNGNTILITITLQGGKLSYSLDPAEITQGTRVEWICQHPFSVYFDWNGPWQNHTFAGAQSPEKRIYQNGDRLPDDTDYRKYKYSVSVWTGKEIVMDDPEIIVKR